MLQVSTYVVDEPDATSVAMFLLDLVEPSELEASLTDCFFSEQPRADMTFYLLLDVETKLLIELLLDRPSFEDRTKPKDPIG
ncbi:MAG: hypothetical protein GEV06_22700 [Luteitalea sp.]|nr:hypothetical protein [Luteitalea sp.]